MPNFAKKWKFRHCKTECRVQVRSDRNRVARSTRSSDQDFDWTNSTGPSGFLQLQFLSDRDRLARSARSIDGEFDRTDIPPVTECRNRTDELASPDRLDRATRISSDREPVLLRNLSQFPTIFTETKLYEFEPSAIGSPSDKTKLVAERKRRLAELQAQEDGTDY